MTMPQYDNRNRGALFSNAEKKTKETDADFGGSINVAGVDYWINGWTKTAKNTGAEFLSLSVTPKQAR
jgi:hypothetical protein